VPEIDRRHALKWLAAASLAACKSSEPRPGAGRSAVIGIQPLTTMQWPTPDPFLFCVHHDDAYPAGNDRFGPAAPLDGRQLGNDFAGRDGWRMYHGDEVPGFPQHPHRGFETITIVRRGLLDHSDSLGAAARYGQGDVQWLTAGRGIQHAEMFPLLDRTGPNPVELFQIWLNLPRTDKLAAPHFSMLWSHAIPRHIATDANGRTTEVTVIAGALAGRTAPSPPPSSWASRPDSDVAIWTIKMSPGATWRLPAASPGTQRWLYAFRGPALGIGGRSIPPAHVVDLEPDVVVPIENGDRDTELLLLQGRPIAEPIVKHGPFVMNTRDEIRDTVIEYQRTQFGGWSWSTREPVHGSEARFARHANGRIERPA
jgi:quercetin 2,3-dioxygenase